MNPESGDEENGYSPTGEIFRRVRNVLLCSAALCAIGAVLSPLSSPATKATSPRNFSFSKAESSEAVTEGAMISLGGLRTLAADAFWLRAYVMWEQEDRGSCAAFSRLACLLAPENSYFREGYANWLAFDFPYWTIKRIGGEMKVAQPVQDAIKLADAKEAMAYLDHEMARDPDEYRYPAVASTIAMIKFKDFERAAMFDRRAAETPAGPWSLTLRYANHLANTGRLREAVAWLGAYAESRPKGTMSRAFAEEWLAPAREQLKKETK